MTKITVAVKSDLLPPRSTSVKKMTEEEKGYARAAVRLKVSRAVWLLWNQLRNDKGVDQNWLVERLGSNKSRVSRLLNGSGNWTLDTVADLLEAMEGRLTLVEVKQYKEIDASSQVEPSLSGLRDNPGLWNILVTTLDNENSVDAISVDASVEILPALKSANRPRVISSEAI